MKKNQKQLQDKLGNKFGPEVSDAAILENIDQEERDLADFVSRCIIFDPEQRLSCEDALKHPFLANQAKKRLTPWSTALLGSRGCTSTQDTRSQDIFSA